MDIGTVSVRILEIIDEGGGRITFDKLKENLSFREQQLMIRALRQLKAEGVAQKQNRIVNRKPVFEVFRIGAAVPRDPVVEGGD